MRDYIIATDSCCDFDENLIRELDLTVIPLSVHLGQDHFRNYPGEMPESHVFYTRLSKGEPAQTSAPNGDGALPDGGNGVFAQRILSKVGFYGMLDLFFGTFDIHNIFPSCQELFSSRYRSSSSARASARALAGRAAAPVNSSSSSTTFIAHGGTLASSNRSPKNRKAVS